MIKRTNLVIDVSLLKEAKKILESDTNSATVNEALAEVIRISRLKTLASFFGKDDWSGALPSMREDQGALGSNRKLKKKVAS